MSWREKLIAAKVFEGEEYDAGTSSVFSMSMQVILHNRNHLSVVHIRHLRNHNSVVSSFFTASVKFTAQISVFIGIADFSGPHKEQLTCLQL